MKCETWVMRLVAAAAVAGTGCATVSPLREQRCEAPDTRLLAALTALPPDGCGGQYGGADASERCIAVRGDVARLLSVCPAHEPTMLSAAVLAYESRDPERAQQWLDDLLGRPGAHPEAASLRARIAIEAGNLPFAHRLLREQLRLRPDHAGLHETLASALFLSDEYGEAERHLSTAVLLGAPSWRVAYHKGLLAETQGRTAEAERLYEAAVAENPMASEARGRLRALRAEAAEPPAAR